MRDPHQCFVEESLPCGRYRVVKEGTYDECVAFLEPNFKGNRLEVWCNSWVETEFGHAAMAWVGEIPKLPDDHIPYRCGNCPEDKRECDNDVKGDLP